MASQATMSEAITRDVRVQVVSRFHPEQSDPVSGLWFFSYRVRIHNQGSVPVRLVARHWIITDANGHQEHVRGAGVVGQQPEIAPGQSFEYISGCPLPTSMGTMHGSYVMVGPDGVPFEARIAPFTLADPLTIN